MHILFIHFIYFPYYRYYVVREGWVVGLLLFLVVVVEPP